MSSALDQALRLVDQGVMRVDAEVGLVYRTFVSTLYTYERPIGGLGSRGYVVLAFEGQYLYAHRLIWAVATGEVIPDAMVINHVNGVKHDNRRANLELVTNAENIQHAYDTGLSLTGERSPTSKLPDEEVRRIFALQFAEGCSQREMSMQYGISMGLVSHIRCGRRRIRQVVATP